MIISKENKHFMFTGGGSAGHVSVNTALIPYFQQKGWKTSYIGSKEGIEKEIILERFSNVPYFSISSGKLRRYFSWKNVKDPFLVAKGILEAYRILQKNKPAAVFSKGGFVTVPVAIAAKLRGVPLIIHESDLTPGLANKIAAPFASSIFTTFPETAKLLPGDKTTHCGAIVRKELFNGNPDKGYRLCQFEKHKDVLLVMGGSLGAKRINDAVRSALPSLLPSFNIIHLCGKGNIDRTFTQKGYVQFEFVNKELPDLLAITSLVVSRAGSNSIFEFLALKKPMLLIPLSRKASRGDQIENAQSFVRQGFAQMMEEEDLTVDKFISCMKSIQVHKEKIIEKMGGLNVPSVEDMYEQIIRSAQK
ncbi:undecaprenyldiphospho-muramoylpentapeptide beta-N-acetylglucosaminyltransferase [Falsibacillus albus]|uniref:UDP-N-acetylglucosamine--N-acetylmuramyl-(pentapeptide) pyrophosphoryl-undecaprenol N-acetylglucosamine transferase n=1 Tax=Falsibacillus albus TaxID=2478915 RepID=A0A3L7JZW0_9BACI|nr:undecaprenyldiphospho-muramoylpentapeptide beta-N-acetylglucosaminyltransferase [Falsibacillus albus]RLQ95221.1 undecaprenyldiphospho-muramoylpentapeptide beta-N-acetylglucosaminyltransferase [Falsibacillus albus]